MIRIVLAIVFFIFSVNSMASSPSLRECTPIKTRTDGKNIILSSDLPKGSSQVYYLRNISNKSLWLDHPQRKAGANAGWSSYLRTGNWSALIVNRKEFSVSCAVIQPGNVDYLNCSQAITVCTPNEILARRKGTYWVVEDKSWSDVSKVVNKLIKK